MHVVCHKQVSLGISLFSACQTVTWFTVSFRRLYVTYKRHVWSCQNGKLIYSIKLLEHADKQTGQMFYVWDIKMTRRHCWRHLFVWVHDCFIGPTWDISVVWTVYNKVYNGIRHVLWIWNICLEKCSIPNYFTFLHKDTPLLVSASLRDAFYQKQLPGGIACRQRKWEHILYIRLVKHRIFVGLLSAMYI